MADATDTKPIAAARGDVLAPEALPNPATATQSLALVQRLARSQPPSTALQAALDGPLHAAVQAAAIYAQDSLAAPTRDAYQRDWLDFAAWCHAHGADPGELPVNPMLVAAWLAGLAPTHGGSALRPAARRHRPPSPPLWRRVHARPPGDPRDAGGHPPRPSDPGAAGRRADLGQIKRLSATCPNHLAGPTGFASPAGLAGLRDRALLLVGFAGAFRRSELVGIDHHHLRFDARGVVIRIPRSKADQEGKGADVSLPRMRDPDSGVPSPTCPVAALETWLRRGKIRAGAVFRAISVHGTIEERLTGAGVRHILLKRAATAKLTVHPSKRLSPHGLRAGLITEAYLAGAPDEQVAKHTRHRDLSSMRGYRRRARVTADNPARLVDL